MGRNYQDIINTINQLNPPKQSIQTKVRKLKYQIGKGVRNILGQPEPKIRKQSEYKK
tara:strand:+ start:354 stop:524 length:171 start_codon:yes stop_codon:yes gene_type:complete